MAKVAVNTGSIGETSYRADGLFGNEVNERDIIDLRNSSHKVQDYKRLLEREFNKAVSGEIRGEEGELFIKGLENINCYYQGNTTLGFYTNTGSSDVTTLFGINNAQMAYQNKEFYFTLKGGTTHKATLSSNQTSYIWYTISPAMPTMTVGAQNIEMALYLRSPRQSTRKKSNTTLHCDIIGNPANYYRGQTYIDITTQDIAIGDVIWAKTASGGGTAGNFYKALTVQSAIDLATQDYSNATNWTDLGSDWDGAGSWRTGVSGTPLVVGENGEDYSYDGTSKSFKFSKKVISNKFRLYSDDYGVTWGYSTDYVGIGYSATTNSIGPFVTTPTHRIHMFFYETHTNMAENAVNSEVLALGDVSIGIAYGISKFMQSLINKIPIVFSSYIKNYKLDNIFIDYNAPQLNEYFAFKPTHAFDTYGIIGGLDKPTIKVFPYITKENNKAYLNLVFKEMKYDVDWGDDSKFNIVDNVSTTTDDNGNTVLIGQKRIELPYFIEDKE